MSAEKKPCVTCGGPKAFGKGRRKCDPCQAAYVIPKKPRTAAQLERHNAYMKASYAANPGPRKEYQRRRRHAARTLWIERLGGRCVFCGDVESLQFDHRDWRFKAFEISKRFDHPDLESEMAKCQLLCVPCHKLKTAGDKRLMRGLARGY